MYLPEMLSKLRADAKLSQQELADRLGVSRQAVQKWEKGSSSPDLPNLIRLSRIFGITVDSMIFGSTARTVEEMESSRKIKPALDTMHSWEVYSSQLPTEFRQSMDEGLDVAAYEELFSAVRKLPLDETKEKLADILYSIVMEAPMRKDYAYDEPSDLEGIFRLRPSRLAVQKKPVPENYREHLTGAWYGRIIGCLLGKPVEGIRTEELHPLLKESGNFPMHRYILSTDVTQQMLDTFKFRLSGRCFADTVSSMPVDDDTNYTVLYQELIATYGRDFTPRDVSRFWISRQSRDAYCTAERVAFHNFIEGYLPPQSAVYKNPFREWIGAQIRGDYFGYVNPGDPEAAAAMAWRDACIAQVKNGIYGELFVAAALAVAATTENIEEIILGGLSQVPATSRFYERITAVLDAYRGGMSETDFFDDLHKRYDEHDGYDWCHTISNAEIVAASLLWGKSDFGRSVCMAVEQGFDTDCNGATVGSILGMALGIGAIGEEWISPLHGKLSTSIFGVGTVEIDSLVEKTFSHLVK